MNILEVTYQKPTKADRTSAINRTVNKYPEIIDYYIKSKEDSKESVVNLTKDKIRRLTSEIIDALSSLGDILFDKSDFYKILPNSYDEALNRVRF